MESEEEEIGGRIKKEKGKGKEWGGGKERREEERRSEERRKRKSRGKGVRGKRNEKRKIGEIGGRE